MINEIALALLVFAAEPTISLHSARLALAMRLEPPIRPKRNPSAAGLKRAMQKRPGVQRVSIDHAGFLGRLRGR